MPALSIDLLSFFLSLLIFAGYEAYVRRQSARDPNYSVQQVMMQTRAAWVEAIMRDRRDILAVQSFRNSIMAASLFASTSVLLIMGVLTLSEQGDKLSSAWHALNVVGQVGQAAWVSKLLVMLFDLLVAFFSFASAVRLYHHIGYLINVPPDATPHAQPAHVVAQLNRAGRFYTIGTRAYYLLVPLLMWLFGPHLMVLTTIALVWLLHHLERNPTNDDDLAG